MLGCRNRVALAKAEERHKKAMQRHITFEKVHTIRDIYQKVLVNCSYGRSTKICQLLDEELKQLGAETEYARRYPEDGRDNDTKV